MTDADTTDRLRAIVSEITRRDASQLAEGADLVQELGLDSLEGLRVLALVEKRFGVRFPDESLHEIRTLARLRAAVDGARP